MRLYSSISAVFFCFSVSHFQAHACDTKKVVTGYMRSFKERDVMKTKEFLSNTAYIYDSAFNATKKGKKEIVEKLLSPFFSVVNELKWEPLKGYEPVALNNTVSVQWVLSGVPSEKIKNLPESLVKKFEARGMSYFKVDTEDCKILEQHDYYAAPKFYSFL